MLIILFDIPSLIDSIIYQIIISTIVSSAEQGQHVYEETQKIQ